MAEQEINPDRSLWEQLVWLVQHVWASGTLPTQLPWAILVLLPKSDGGTRGIGLLEVIWKVVSSILDGRIKATIPFHDALHGFQMGRGTGTAIIEAKLFQQLANIGQVPVFEVFLDLKAYDMLNRERTLELLRAYGVGDKACTLLARFWEQMQVVARQSGYHGKALWTSCGVTQGDIISPTIFNIVVDAVVRHWLSQVVGEGSEITGLGQTVADKLTIFYADDGLVAARDHEWLQHAIDVLSGLFERVGLRTNINKTKCMSCMPGHISDRMSTAAYKRRMEGTGLSHRERQRRRVECSECGVELAASSLQHHRRTIHGLLMDTADDNVDHPGHQAQRYRVSFPKSSQKIRCPVDGCPGTATTPYNLRRHFAHRHPTDTLTILEEGSAPLPKCERCGMHVTYLSLNTSHYNSTVCWAGAAHERQRCTIQDARHAREVVFMVHGTQLEAVSEFRYLGCPFSSTDDDWPAVYRNLSKACKQWARIAHVLSRTGASPRTSSMFYQAVVQSVLLYGSETWTLSATMLKALGGFHNRVARKLSGLRPTLIFRDQTWVYPPTAEVLEKAHLQPITHYISARQNRLAESIATRPILHLCRTAERQSGSTTRLWWWKRQLS